MTAPVSDTTRTPLAPGARTTESPARRPEGPPAAVDTESPAAVRYPAEGADAASAGDGPVPSAPNGSTAARRARVHARGTTVVDAVVVSRDAGRWLPGLLAALGRSSVQPRRVVVADTDGSAADVVASGPLPGGDVCVVRVPRGGRRAALARAVEVLDASAPTRAGFVWLLQDDVAPEPDALAHLARAALADPTVGVVGPKYLSAAHPDRLVEIGLTMSPAGRLLASPRHGELDQGQHDDRHDTLAVSLGAALVRRDVLDTLGGTDRAFDGTAADVDLCWRAHRAGHRVVVVPAARVLDARATAHGLRGLEPMPYADVHPAEAEARGVDRHEIARQQRSWDRERRARARAAERARRRGLRLVALTRAPWWQAPLRAAGLVLTSLVTSLLLVLLKRPRAAVAELSDAFAVLHPLASLRARWRARRGRTVRERELRGLFASPHATRRTVLDEMYLALPHLPVETAHTDPEEPAAEPGPVADDAVDLPAPALGVNPGALAVLAALVVALLAWRSTWRGDLAGALRTGLVGGELTGAGGTPADLARATLTGWSDAGLGGPTGDGAWTLVLAALGWVAGLVPAVHRDDTLGGVVALLLMAAIPLSALTAYLAGRVAVRARWPRALAALLWAVLPTLVLGLREGRLAVAVTHVLLPLVVAGIAVTARRRPTTWLVAAAALVTAVAGAFQPLLLAVTGITGLALTIGPRRTAGGRLAGLVLAVLPVALQGPAVRQWWHEPWRLTTGPGLVDRGPADLPTWATALGWPGAPVVPAELTRLVTWAAPGATGWAPWLPLVTAALVVVGVLSFLRRGQGDAGRTGLALLAVAGLVLALGAPRLVIGTERATGPSRDLHPWSGGALDLLLLALVAAYLLGLGRRGPAGPRRRRAQRVAAGLATALVGLTALLLAAWTTVATADADLRVAGVPVPPAARIQAASDLATRTLVLVPDAASTPAAPRIGYRSIGWEPGPLVRDVAAPSSPRTSALVAGTVAGTVDGTTPQPAAALHALAVGFVTLADDPAVGAAATSRAVARLDTTQGLARIAGADAPTWRVLPEESPSGAAILPSRVRAVGPGPDGRTERPYATLPYADGRVDAELPAGATAVVLADGVDAAHHREVRVDGRRVEPTADARGLARYALPPGAQQVEVTPVVTDRWWRWGTLALLLVTVVVALPVGVRRDRGPR